MYLVLSPEVSNGFVFAVSITLIRAHPAINFWGGGFPALATVSGNKRRSWLCLRRRLIKLYGKRGLVFRAIEADGHV